jgi:hypothetical protein
MWPLKIVWTSSKSTKIKIRIFFVRNGVKAGAARRFVSDIARWVTRNRDTIGVEE